MFGTAPPTRGQDVGAQGGSDPPARVGRLARLVGDVSTHNAGITQWTPAVLNFPFVSGDSLWTQPQAQAEIDVGESVIVLADRSEFDLATLDEQTLVAEEPQGAVFLDLRHVRPGETYTLNTPRGAVQVATDGEYEVLAGDAATPTRLVVVRGAAQLTSGDLALRVGPGQIAVATGGQGSVQGDVEPLPSYDPFLTAMLSRYSVPLNAPEIVQGMTGAQDLSQYGSWQSSPSYGEVWYPQVAPDWVPYRDGSWSYVEPWGWTWVDSEPWGFAPFHYGRWAQIGPRWCWVPGEEAREDRGEPVYAPALVDFVVAGAAVGVAAGVLAASLRSRHGDVGWVPLGPHEAYTPPYRGSRRYLGRLNPGAGWHHAQWRDKDHDRGHGGFMNRDAATIAPAAAMARSQPIRHVGYGIGSKRALAFRQAASIQAVRGSVPVHPTTETHGITPRVAHRLGIAGMPARPHAPGPPPRPVYGGPPPLRPHEANRLQPAIEPRGAMLPDLAPRPAAPRPAAPHMPLPQVIGPRPGPERLPARPQPPRPAPAPQVLRPHVFEPPVRRLQEPRLQEPRMMAPRPMPMPAIRPMPMPAIRPMPMPAIRPMPMPAIRPMPMPAPRPMPMPAIRPMPMQRPMQPMRGPQAPSPPQARPLRPPP